MGAYVPAQAVGQGPEGTPRDRGGKGQRLLGDLERDTLGREPLDRPAEFTQRGVNDLSQRAADALGRVGWQRTFQPKRDREPGCRT